MNRATFPLSLPDYVFRAAEVQARISGKSLEQWVSRVIAANLDSDEATQEFFRVRAVGATPDGLRRALDAVPDRPPDPGDSFED
jgi:hypothetical protein